MTTPCVLVEGFESRIRADHTEPHLPLQGESQSVS